MAIPKDVQELGDQLGQAYALRINALSSPAIGRVIETLGKLREVEDLRASQNSGCQNGQCGRSLLDEITELQS